MKLVLNHINVKHQNHLNTKYAEIKFIIFGLCTLCYYIWIFSKLSGLLLNILYHLNFKTGHVNCHISLPFEVPKCLSSPTRSYAEAMEMSPMSPAL